jgi:hypothetical protein
LFTQTGTLPGYGIIADAIFSPRIKVKLVRVVASTELADSTRYKALGLKTGGVYDADLFII